MMEWKMLGICMIFPTVSIAFLITYLTRKSNEVYINIAICFWIMANAFWMCCEFFGHVEYKLLRWYSLCLWIYSYRLFLSV